MRLLVLLFVLVPVSLLADRVVLKNGKQYRGKFISGESGKIQFRVNQTVRTFFAADISRLEIGDKPAPDLPRKTPVQEPDPVVIPPRTPVETPRAASPAPAPPPPLSVPEVGAMTTAPVEGSAAVDSEYTRMGSDGGVLGPPRAPQQPTSDRRATVRFYNNGAIYWTPAAGAHAITGPIFSAWAAQGGEQSRLGYPTTDEDISNAGFSRRQGFEGGTITWSQGGNAIVQYSAR